MIYLGLGLEDAHHPWSEDGHSFSSKELLIHLVDTAMPLARTSVLPTEAPAKAPRMPSLPRLGTSSALSKEKEQLSKDEESKFKVDATKEIERLESIGKMDMWSEKQSTLPPSISSCNGFKLEMCFTYPGADGSPCLDWYRGKVKKVLNKDRFSVLIEWDPDTLAANDVKESVHRLIPSKWNPKTIRKNAWREYLTT